MREDNIEALLSELVGYEGPWQQYVNPETGKVVIVFPRVKNYRTGTLARREQEDDWEIRALAMHASQKTLIIESKPLENMLAAKRIERGD